MKRDFTHNIKAKECNRKNSDDIEEVIWNKNLAKDKTKYGLAKSKYLKSFIGILNER